MMTRLQVLLLRTIARVVPAGERSEWLAEWLTELWYTVQEGKHVRLTGFCLGAFCDALWQRRNAPVARYGSLLLKPCLATPEPPAIPFAPVLKSPRRCLFLIASLAALGMFFAWFSSVPLRSTAGLSLGLLAFCAFYWPLALAADGALPGEYPRHRNWLGRGSFFLAKLTLLVFAIACGLSIVPIFPLRIDGALFCTACALRWAMMDQRRRCPDCLHILDNPVRMGNHSRIFLEWNGTELLCMRGHGVMHVPERPAIWFRRQRWLPLI